MPKKNTNIMNYRFYNYEIFCFSKINIKNN